VEALFLLTNTGRGCGAGLNHENAPGPRHQLARVLARRVMIMPGKHHVDAGFLDRVERQLLPADRALDLPFDLQREQRMMSDDHTHAVARRAREGLADELDLLLVDASVLEGQRASGVDA